MFLIIFPLETIFKRLQTTWNGLKNSLLKHRHKNEVLFTYAVWQTYLSALGYVVGSKTT